MLKFFGSLILLVARYNQKILACHSLWLHKNLYQLGLVALCSYHVYCYYIFYYVFLSTCRHSETKSLLIFQNCQSIFSIRQPESSTGEYNMVFGKLGNLQIALDIDMMEYNKAICQKLSTRIQVLCTIEHFTNYYLLLLFYCVLCDLYFPS